MIVTRLGPDQEAPRICFVNEAAVRLLGYDRAELLSHGPDLWQGPDGDIAGLETIGETLHSGETVAIETVVRRKDGVELAVRVQMSPHQSVPGVSG